MNGSRQDLAVGALRKNADQLFYDKNALKSALKFFKSAEIVLTPRDVSKNTIWSGGLPSYSRVMALFIFPFSFFIFLTPLFLEITRR